MNNNKYIVALLMVGCISFSAQAMPKIDVSKMAQKIMEQVGKVQEEAGKIQTQLANVKQLETMKDAAGEFNKIKKTVSDTAKQVNDAKNSVEKSVGDVQRAAGDAQKAVNDAQNSATKALGNAQNGLGGSGAQQLLSLQTELAQEQQNLTNQLKALDDEMTAEIKPLQDNNKILQQEIERIEQQLNNQAQQSKGQVDEGEIAISDQRPALQKKIDENNAKIQEIREKYKKQQAEKQEAFNATKSSLSEKMNKLKDMAGMVDLKSMNFDSAQKALSGFFGSNGSAAMSETMKNNFYATGEQESPARNGEIAAYRKKVALDDTADVYARAVKIMSYGDKYVVAIKDLETQAKGAETETVGPMLQMSAKLQQMKILLNYAYLSVAELKMTTALDMIAMNPRLDNPEKDPSEFNLDDYRDYKKAKERKEKSKGLLSSVKNLYDKGKKYYDDHSDDIKNAVATVKEGKELYQDINSAISSGAIPDRI